MKKTKLLQLKFMSIGFELTVPDTGKKFTILSGDNYSRSLDIYKTYHPECDAIGEEIYNFILNDCLHGESMLKGVEVDITVRVDIKSQHQ